MMRFKILNNKKKREILKRINSHWGASFDTDCAFVVSSKNKAFMIDRDLALLDLDKLRVDSLGLYLAEFREDEVRLSMEGSRLVGVTAKRNVVELGAEDFRSWLKGDDINFSGDKIGDASGFFIVKHDSDYAGCGKYSKGVIMNFVPKTRRILCSD